MMTKEAYIEIYANRISERTDLSKQDALSIAEVGYESFLDINGPDDMNSPSDDADEDMSYWDNDE
jgi:hypothetical protein